jgi:single-stranded DNA-binding protein
MTATVLIIGALHRDPVMRTAKTGKAFVTALLRSESQGETLWVNAVAFDEAAQVELMRLKAGESLSVQGKLRVSI